MTPLERTMAKRLRTEPTRSARAVVLPDDAWWSVCEYASMDDLLEWELVCRQLRRCVRRYGLAANGLSARIHAAVEQQYKGLSAAVRSIQAAFSGGSLLELLYMGNTRGVRWEPHRRDVDVFLSNEHADATARCKVMQEWFEGLHKSHANPHALEVADDYWNIKDLARRTTMYLYEREVVLDLVEFRGHRRDPCVFIGAGFDLDFCKVAWDGKRVHLLCKPALRSRSSVVHMHELVTGNVDDDVAASAFNTREEMMTARYDKYEKRGFRIVR